MTFEDIKTKFEECSDKIKNDPDLGKKFKADPVKTVEDTLGVNLPDEQVKAAADFVKAKVEGIDTTEILNNVKKSFDGVVADAKAGTLDDKLEAKVKDVVDDVKEDFEKSGLEEKAEGFIEKVKDMFHKDETETK